VLHTDVLTADEITPTPGRQARSVESRIVVVVLIGLVAFSLAAHLVALRRDLPLQDFDEAAFVKPAVHIASTGDLNPHWFGHPGSTVIYPLAAFFHAWDAVAHHGPLVSSSAELARRFQDSPTEYYLIGRLWAITLSVGTIPLLFLVGRRAFSTRVALVGAALWSIVPLGVHYGRIVRTDSAALFFGLLALWMCLRILDRPSMGNHVLAGLIVGVAISSRYFTVTLVPVLLAASIAAQRREELSSALRKALAGIGAVVAGFVLTTPYFLLDLNDAASSLQTENGSHVGHDGLSPLGNLRYYLGNAIPSALSWPMMIAAAVGVVLIIKRRRREQLLLLLFTATFLVGISVSKLHWQRWALQIFPLLVLFAAFAADTAARAISARFGRVQRAPAVAIAVLVVVAVSLTVVPGQALIEAERRDAAPSTRAVARDWVIAHVPAGSRVIQEFGTAPLKGNGFLVDYRFTLAPGHSVIDYQRAGYQYLVVNARLSGYYKAQRHRYPQEAAFYYEDLVRTGRLIHAFYPSNTRSGPAIRVFELPPAPA
jgi:hypothetical protein